LTQPELDTTSATGRLVFTILAAVAEMERELIRDRVKEGMRHAAAKGARIGRPAVTSRPGFATRWERIRCELAAGRISRRGAARRLGIGTATLSRLLAADPATAPSLDTTPTPSRLRRGRGSGNAGAGRERDRRAGAARSATPRAIPFPGSGNG
jgi:DNA invertase Pin-like site-specific DNA recombinase